MVSLEQVKLLESKVTRMIEYVKKVNEENSRLKEKLDSYEKRTGELEVLFQRFKEDQGRIEDGILSALNLLNQFEDAMESKLSLQKNAVPETAETEISDEIPEKNSPEETSPEIISPEIISGEAYEEAPEEEKTSPEEMSSGDEPRSSGSPASAGGSGPVLSRAELDIF